MSMAESVEAFFDQVSSNHIDRRNEQVNEEKGKQKKGTTKEQREEKNSQKEKKEEMCEYLKIFFASYRLCKPMNIRQFFFILESLLSQQLGMNIGRESKAADE